MGRRTPGLGLWTILLVVVMMTAAAWLEAGAEQVTLVADAHVNAALPAVNSGAISNINVGGGYTGLVQFDLSLLPAGTTSAQISRAVLRLYVNRVDTAGLVSLQPVGAAWSEYGVTFQTLPALGSAASVFNVPQSGAYVAVDVTAVVQGWVSAPAGNHGLALTAGTAVVAVRQQGKRPDGACAYARCGDCVAGAGWTRRPRRCRRCPWPCRAAGSDGGGRFARTSRSGWNGWGNRAGWRRGRAGELWGRRVRLERGGLPGLLTRELIAQLRIMR